MEASTSPAAAPDPASLPTAQGPPRPAEPVFPPAPEHVFPPPPAPVSRLRRLATPVGVMAAVIGAFAYVATVDPNEPGHYPACPMLRFTGLLCPGCGGLRSAHAFAHGDIGTALGANAPAVIGYVLFAAVWMLWMARAARGGTTLRIGLAPVYRWGVGAVLLVFSIVRNLPFGSGLAP